MSTSSTSPNSSLTGSPLLTLAAAIGMILMLIPCPAVAVPVSVSIKSPGHRHRRTIVNGSTAGQNEYQYASSIQFGSRHICGASLIAPDIILSAAHCFKVPGDYRDGRLTVVIGEYHLQDREDTGQVFLVEKIHAHPDYLETLQYLENDVMIMKIIGRSEGKIVKLNHKPNLPVLAIDALTVVGCRCIDGCRMGKSRYQRSYHGECIARSAIGVYIQSRMSQQGNTTGDRSNDVCSGYRWR